MIGTESVYWSRTQKQRWFSTSPYRDWWTRSSCIIHAVFFSDRIFTGVVLSVPHIASGTLHHTGEAPGPRSNPATWRMTSPRPGNRHRGWFYLPRTITSDTAFITAVSDEGGGRADGDNINTGGWRQTLEPCHVTVTLPNQSFSCRIVSSFTMNQPEFWGERCHILRGGALSRIFYWWLTLPQNAVHRKLIKFSRPDT